MLNFRYLIRPFINAPYFHQLKAVRTIVDDKWTNVPDSDVSIKYYLHLHFDLISPDIMPVAQINYSLATGQIGIIYVPSNYRRYGYGTHMLADAINHIKEYGKADTVWAVTSKTHEFWLNACNKTFNYHTPAHSSVWGGGFVADIKKL